MVSPKCLVFEIRVLISLKNHETFHFFLILLCVIGVSFVLCLDSAGLRLGGRLEPQSLGEEEAHAKLELDAERQEAQRQLWREADNLAEGFAGHGQRLGQDDLGGESLEEGEAQDARPGHRRA